MKIFFNAILFIFFYATPLHLAIEKGNIEIVRLLLSKPNLNINSKYTIKSEESDDPYECTALHLATRLKKTDILRLLLMYDGADVNIEDSLGRTPIKCATDPEIKVLFDDQDCIIS